jgi:opacity protein-like surface antigen
LDSPIFMKRATSTLFAVCLLGAALLATPATAAAQPVPDSGQVAAGVDLGLFLPPDDRLDSAFIGGGFFEFYLTPRVGVRTSVMSLRPEYQGRLDEQERQVRIGADVIYNWEYVQIHPFVGGGIGIHLMRTHARGDNVGINHNKLGISALGGFEYFINRDWAVKAEGRYQWVGDIPFVDPSGFALTLGIKRYF